MKRILPLILLAVSGMTYAQKAYDQLLDKTRQQSPYEAVYTLMAYQQRQPKHANVYYQMGNHCYTLLPTRTALYHYNELSTLLYQTRLFYGNCLHFAKGQELAGTQYAEIAGGKKKLEYEVLERYIRPRMKEVARRKVACDSIHFSFYRLVDRYGRCQHLFTDFLDRYTREKTAHLNLRPEEQQLLIQLRQAADSLDGDIRGFQQALALEPVEGYTPVFRKEPILLYRLDGVTTTDFLRNDIPLWDYSQWVTRFLREQTEVYEQLYADLQKEHDQLLRQITAYRKGKHISGQIDQAMVGRCRRLELVNAQTQALPYLQYVVRRANIEQTLAATGQPATKRELKALRRMAEDKESVTVSGTDSRWTSVTDSINTLIENRLNQFALPLEGQEQEL